MNSFSRVRVENKEKRKNGIVTRQAQCPYRYLLSGAYVGAAAAVYPTAAMADPGARKLQAGCGSSGRALNLNKLGWDDRRLRNSTPTSARQQHAHDHLPLPPPQRAPTSPTATIAPTALRLYRIRWPHTYLRPTRVRSLLAVQPRPVKRRSSCCTAPAILQVVRPRRRPADVV